MRSFVGLCFYYRRHSQGFTELAAPLYELATKGTDFEWTDRRHEAFGQLKNAQTSAPILGFPREDGLWYLDTHAGDVGTGAVLSQVQDEEERVVAYVSKSLEGSKQRYCTARKELLAVVWALKHFKCYLYGQKITVRTDNSAVSWLHRSKDPVGQPARWSRAGPPRRWQPDKTPTPTPDGCGWSVLTARTGSGKYRVRTTRRRNSGLDGG